MHSSKEISQINPPQNLQPSDWVIDLPRPELHPGVPLAIARQHYQSTRIQHLVGYIDKRFDGGRCFYEFLNENKDKDLQPGQTLVTNVFAYHEIEHWPGADAHVKWTEFVMGNVEYDARAEAQASEEGLSLPLLPMNAVPIFRTVQQTQGKKLAKKAARTGKSVKELTAYQFERAEPAVEAHISALEPQLDEASTSARVPPAVPYGSAPVVEPFSPNRVISVPTQHNNIPSQGAPLDTPYHHQQAAITTAPDLFFLHIILPPFRGYLNRGQLLAACHNFGLFQKMSAGHAGWVTHIVKQQHRFVLRIIFANRESTDKSWHFCHNLARKKIHDFAEGAFQEWRQHNPDVPFDGFKVFPNWLRKMYEYLLATLQFRDPMPANLDPRIVRLITMKQMVITMVRQQNILSNWDRELRMRAAVPGELRYRAEENVLLDLWTGTVIQQPYPVLPTG